MYDEGVTKEIARLYMLRQQLKKKATDKPNTSLSDFIAPKNSGKQDYIAMFVASADFVDVTDKFMEIWHKKHLEDLSAVLFKTFCNRLADACAEYLHQQVYENL